MLVGTQAVAVAVDVAAVAVRACSVESTAPAAYTAAAVVAE